MVRTPCLHCKGHEFDPCWRKFRSHMPRGGAQKPKHKTFSIQCFLQVKVMFPSSSPSEVGLGCLVLLSNSSTTRIWLPLAGDRPPR